MPRRSCGTAPAGNWHVRRDAVIVSERRRPATWFPSDTKPADCQTGQSLPDAHVTGAPHHRNRRITASPHTLAPLYAKGGSLRLLHPRNPRYEAHEGARRCVLRWAFAAQFSLIASSTLLVTPVVVARASGQGEGYLLWVVFASLLAVGAATILQVRRLGPAGAGATMPMFHRRPFTIPFCITAVSDSGPATLMALIVASAVVQVIISRWLFILRRIVTPTVGGTVMMILSVTLASVVFGLLDDATTAEPVPASLTALVTLVIVAGLTLRFSAALRLWAPVIGIVVGCVVAAALGIFDFGPIVRAPWVGMPPLGPGMGELPDLGVSFWSLLPSFPLFWG